MLRRIVAIIDAKEVRAPSPFLVRRRPARSNIAAVRGRRESQVAELEGIILR
jgi:hypothetical protein